MKKLLFVMNPYAGTRRANKYLPEIITTFNRAGYEVNAYMTAGPGDGARMVQQRCGDMDLVVCAGGDGTLNEAVSGLMEMKDAPMLGYIPGGTVNDVAHSLGLSRDPVQAARDIVEGTPTAIDVGLFGGNRWFTYVAGFGAFTDVPYETPQADKRALGRLAYLLKGAQSLGGIKPIPVRVELDDRVIEEDVLLGLVCSTVSVGGFRAKTLEEKARLDDGLSEVILVKNITSLQDLNGLGTLITKREFDPRFFHTFQTSHVKFQFPHGVKWTLDGEFGGTHGAVEIENRHKALHILVPKK